MSFLAGFLISVFAEWFPGFSNWFHNELSSKQRRDLMLVAYVIIGVGLALGTCAGGLDFGISFECADTLTWRTFFQLVIDTAIAAGTALIGGSATHYTLKRKHE